MNSHYFEHLRRFAAVVLLLAAVVSCSKSGRTTPADILMGSWKVTDVTIVNEEAGIHRSGKDLNGIGNSGIVFGADGSFLTNGSKNGTWIHERDALAVRSLTGEMIQFNVSQSDDGAVRLERDLPAAGGLSGAAVYYSLIKE
jgi:hypothetical protein